MIKFKTTDKNGFTLVEFALPEEPIIPQDLKKISPPSVGTTKGVVLSGRGPIWLYGYLIHHYHPCAWVGVYDPRLDGAVVVESHIRGVNPGDVVEIR